MIYAKVIIRFDNKVIIKDIFSMIKLIQLIDFY